jgi:hypothetical protein
VKSLNDAQSSMSSTFEELSAEVCSCLKDVQSTKMDVEDDRRRLLSQYQACSAATTAANSLQERCTQDVESARKNEADKYARSLANYEVLLAEARLDVEQAKKSAAEHQKALPAMIKCAKEEEAGKVASKIAQLESRVDVLSYEMKTEQECVLRAVQDKIQLLEETVAQQRDKLTTFEMQVSVAKGVESIQEVSTNIAAQVQSLQPLLQDTEKVQKSIDGLTAARDNFRAATAEAKELGQGYGNIQDLSRERFGFTKDLQDERERRLDERESQLQKEQEEFQNSVNNFNAQKSV